MIKDEEVFKGSRKEAVEAGFIYYFTGKPCPEGHLVPRHTEKCKCTTCHPERPKPAGHTGRKNSKKRSKEVIEQEKKERQERRMAREFDRSSYKKALECGDETYPRATPCAYCGGKVFRTTIKKCVDCGPKLSAEYREKTKDLHKERSERYYQENVERLRIASALRYWSKREEYIEYSRKYRQDLRTDPDKLEKHREKAKGYVKKRASILLTPCNEYFSGYVEAAKDYAKTKGDVEDGGVKWCVDHIVPVVNSKVCGLNTPCNIAIIQQEANRDKNNNFFPYWTNEGSGVTVIVEGYLAEKYQAIMEAGQVFTQACEECDK